MQLNVSHVISDLTDGFTADTDLLMNDKVLNRSMKAV